MHINGSGYRERGSVASGGGVIGAWWYGGRVYLRHPPARHDPLGIVIPVLPKLIENFVDNDTASAARTFGLFGTVGVAFGAGFVLGPALGGLFGDYSPRPPFWVAAALSLLNGL